MYITLLSTSRVVVGEKHILYGARGEGLIEYSARLCYASLGQFGKAPDFVVQRIREGHDDILEHVRFVFDIGGFKMERLIPLLTMPGVFHKQDRRSLYLGLNLRNILMFHSYVKEQSATSVNDDLYPLAQQLMRHAVAECPSLRRLYPDILPIRPNDEDAPLTLPDTQSQDGVTLLALTPLRVFPTELGAATFLIENISRACSHQLVRHRLCSFSQESQRYVSLDKGGWKAVVPPAIAENDEAKVILEESWRYLEEAYRKLMVMGIRKEDARFLLPNATETRMVMTIPYATLRHFLELRLHKSAQWEIRKVANAIRQLLVRNTEVFGP